MCNLSSPSPLIVNQNSFPSQLTPADKLQQENMNLLNHIVNDDETNEIKPICNRSHREDFLKMPITALCWVATGQQSAYIFSYVCGIYRTMRP